jgi:hypothetical protein
MALKTSLISYYKFEETTSTRTDSHGANALADNGTVGTTTGIANGNAADFDGSADYFTKASPTGLDFASTDKFSVSYWVNSDDITVYGYHASMYKTSTADRGWNVQQDGASGQLEVNISDDGSNVRIWLSNAAVFTNNTTYHIVVTVDAAADTIVAYVNNSTITMNASGTAQTSMFASAADFVVGGRHGGLSLFNGSIDEMALWNRVITSDEVNEIYAGGSGKFYDNWDATAASDNALAWCNF